MSNAVKFLGCFNEIENWLKMRCDNRDISFTTMINELKKNNSCVRHFYDDLYQFASLRNAIVHTRKMDRVIAEPYDETVAEIEKIKTKLFDPPLVKTFPVLSLKSEDKINVLLAIVQDHNYSQVPLVDQNENVIEILNANTIARLLAAHVKDDLISLHETTVEQLLPHIEFGKNYRFIGKSANLYEAAHIFQTFTSTNKRNLDALFVTHSGQQNQKPIGIVCIEDVAGYFYRS
ncbi:MAG: CBS domain-containing protein [Sphingobacteriia bacterium]|nr:CBS domain-containing protein [Sphingobacteriia bacterium]